MRGRVSCEDDRPSKLICEKIWPFEDIPRELWIQFADKKEYQEREDALFDILRHSEGKDHVAVFVRSERAVRKLGDNWTVNADDAMLEKLSQIFGKENVKVMQKRR